MTVAVLASCQRPALWTWPSCLFLQALPDSFPGAMTGKPTIIRGVPTIAQAKLWLFVKPANARDRKATLQARTRAATEAPPLQWTKKNPSHIGLGFESTKGGGWRRHRAIDGTGHGGRCAERSGYVTNFRFRTLARSSAPSFDGLNYTYGPFGCKKICTTKFNTTI